jgi:D-glycero-alpha-D-manno-heptose-7-phosphate kinase
LNSFGVILHEDWMKERELASGISNERIDGWYEVACRNGAIGGKVLGAGGFLLLFAQPERFPDILRALPELRPVPFHLEPQGSKIIYVEESGKSN